MKCVKLIAYQKVEHGYPGDLTRDNLSAFLGSGGVMVALWGIYGNEKGKPKHTQSCVHTHLFNLHKEQIKQ